MLYVCISLSLSLCLSISHSLIHSVSLTLTLFQAESCHSLLLGDTPQRMPKTALSFQTLQVKAQWTFHKRADTGVPDNE